MNASHCRTLHICFLSLNSHAMHCFQNTAHFYYINTSTLLSEYAISLILIFGSVFVRLLQLHMCKCWAVRETLVMIMLSRSCIDSCQLKSSAVDRCKTCAWPPYIKYSRQCTQFMKDQVDLQICTSFQQQFYFCIQMDTSLPSSVVIMMYPIMYCPTTGNVSEKYSLVPKCRGKDTYLTVSDRPMYGRIPLKGNGYSHQNGPCHGHHM